MLIGAVCIAAALAAAPARAELRMVAGSASPATISFPGPAPLTYTVQLAAEGQDETFSLQFDAPFFGRDPTATSPIGASLAFTGQRPRIDGPAQLLGPASAAMGLVLCSPTIGVHGFDVQRHTWDMRVPAGTTSTLAFDFRPASSSPWPDTSYDVTFRALPRLLDRRAGTLPATQEVTVRGPRTTGARGVHMTLRSTPKTRPAGRRGVARVHRGQRIVIRGMTRPRLAGKRVGIWISTRARPRFRFVQAIHADRRGRFRAAIRARPGLQVMARIAPDGRTTSADYTCPLGFDVRG